MKKATLLYALLTFCVLSSLIAQPPCAFDIKHKELMQTDPAYARTREANDRSIREYIAKHPELKQPMSGGGQNRMMATYNIPVVVHVMHTGGAVGTIYNPSDAQIFATIDYLNQVYAGTYPGMTAPSPGGAAGYTNIQFSLVQRTPACGATNGIDRVDMSGVPAYVSNGVNATVSGGISDVTLKNFARWNVANYYNIWVVSEIDNADGTSGQFIAGYAFYPGAPASQDGTVMLASQFVAGEKTLPHEIGHALNIAHPFEGSNGYFTTPVLADCPTNTNCNTQGDQICDTDPIYDNFDNDAGTYSFACRSGANLCAGGAPYSINTESNFMSYTNCYTLFTNDQKARMIAAMSLPSRSSLNNNISLTPCTTTIDFIQESALHQEDPAGTLTGCRRYTDYTYQMLIGAAPSAAATATLTFSGTATQGVDYDVTTNGDFASPSNVLTFPTASTLARSFIIRVYDDADVESSETLIIDFTVNNGGGNAAKGVTTPTFTVDIPDNDIAPAAFFTGTAGFMGAYTVNLGNQSFLRSTRTRHRAQYLYTPADLNSSGILVAGNLIGINFNVVTKNSTKPFSGFTVSLANTLAANLSTGFIAPAFTQVFTGAYTTTAGNNTITFSTPFAWDGTSNVVVNICWENASADPGDDLIEGNIPGGTMTAYTTYAGAPTAGCSLPANNTSSGRPRLAFQYPTAGTSVETVATSNKNQYMAVASNDYFYSNNSRLLMRLSGISAPLGCVNSVLEEAGITWVNYMGGQRSAKVFAVTPTTNSGTASYTISLYFDNTELGGEIPAALRIAKTTAASAAASNAGNTVLITPTVTTIGANITVFTATFTGFSRFFLVDAGVTLPVDLTEFTAKATDDKNTLLNWTTAFEQSNKQFDIEISNDGVNFTHLATVPSQGNSSTGQRYEYLHVKPQSGTSWYRLKQIDIDGKSKYSQIVAVTLHSDLVKAFVYPVPSKNTITVNFGSLVNKASVDILSADMKLVKRETVNSLSLKKDINIQGLSKGVYFIKLSMENGTQLLRFVKE
jgi:hypothetical protein